MPQPLLRAEVFLPGHTLASTIRQVEDLAGPAGRLEAVLNVPSGEPSMAAVLCHPYPPAGGSLHNKVVYHAMKALAGAGIPVLRFNFRGVGRSEGSFENGHGEEDDVSAALDWLARSYGLPLLCAGFSFGSYVALRASCADGRVLGRIALGLPVRAAHRDYGYAFLSSCPGPLLFVSGDHDEYSPAKTLDAVLVTVPARKRTVIVDGADHFFQGVPASPTPKLAAMQLAISEWLENEFTEVKPEARQKRQARRAAAALTAAPRLPRSTAGHAATSGQRRSSQRPAPLQTGCGRRLRW